MFVFLTRLHGLLLRLCIWLLQLPLKAVWAAVALVLAWLGEEFRRYLGLAVSGAVLVVAGKALLNYAPPDVKRPLALTLLLLLLLWLLAVARAVRYTHFLIRANLQPVRTRQTFRNLFGKQEEIGKQVQGLGRRAYGTPIGGVWKGNRQRRDRERAEAEAAAAQAAQERAEQAAWQEAVAAQRAERERYAAAAAGRWGNRDNQGGRE